MIITTYTHAIFDCLVQFRIGYHNNFTIKVCEIDEYTPVYKKGENVYEYLFQIFVVYNAKICLIVT